MYTFTPAGGGLRILEKASGRSYADDIFCFPSPRQGDRAEVSWAPFQPDAASQARDSGATLTADAAKPPFTGSAPKPCPAAHRVPVRAPMRFVLFEFLTLKVHAERLRGRRGRRPRHRGDAPGVLAVDHVDGVQRVEPPASQRLLREPQCQQPSNALAACGCSCQSTCMPSPACPDHARKLTPESICSSTQTCNHRNSSGQGWL